MNKKVFILLTVFSLGLPLIVKADAGHDFLDALNQPGVYYPETPEEKAARLAAIAIKVAAQEALKSEAAKSVVKQVFSRIGEAFLRIVVKF